jgi:poly-gamma-glutamate capsule biosynthesis protein CapA/YwtB (metallophosphatase superfamily)
MRRGTVTLLLAGDVMLGRGVDQILAHPSEPTLREPLVTDARDYVRLAEHANGPIPRPVDFPWPWGVALEILDRAAPDARIINLETSVTRSGDFDPAKQVHYRMAPDNLPALDVARPDVCTLANNHVLDFGRAGLHETLSTMSQAGLTTAGAGTDAAAASRPATVELGGGTRVLVVAVGMASSGIPWAWAAAGDRAGINLLPAWPDAVQGAVEPVRRRRRPGDIVVVSLHWGSNWGHEVTRQQRALAHALVDEGVDVVFGHSSHHPRPIEVYRDKLILYGCGDLINDYEGIGGHEEHRSDLRLLYLAAVTPGTGTLATLRMVPLQARRMRLERASPQDARWLGATLSEVSRPLGTRIGETADAELELGWGDDDASPSQVRP